MSMKREAEQMEINEVRLAKEALSSMLEDYSKLTTGHKSGTHISDVLLLHLVDERYAEQIKAPIRSILRGDLFQNCLSLIQAHKLKHDLLAEKLLVNTIMRANGLNLAIVAASPTIGGLALDVLIIYGLVKRSQHEGRSARRLKELQHMEAWIAIVHIGSVVKNDGEANKSNS